MFNLARMTAAAALLMSIPASLTAGRIVVTNDEWQTSNTGFTQTPAGSAQFARNVAEWFAGAPTGGNFLIVSNNFSLIPSAATTLKSTIEAQGHTWTHFSTIPGFTFNLATLQGFDGVFLALAPSVSNTVLTNYVNAGGNVYVAAGTGTGGAVAEAGAWNPFLNAFGLQYASTYNGIQGNIPITNPTGHPVLNGVASLYQNNGNSISLVGGNPNASIIQSFNGQGLYAAFSTQDDPIVPEPTTFALIGLGLLAVAGLRRRSG